MPSDERLVDLEFPVGGVNKLQEFQEQPPGTTPEAVNVRGTNPRSLRMRGGSRAGLSRYIDMQIPSGPGLIQHLNVIVDPQAERLGQNFIVPGEDWVEDPLNPGTFVPDGGWGYPPNPNASQPPGPGESGGFGLISGVGVLSGVGQTPSSGDTASYNITIEYQSAFNFLDLDPGNDVGIGVCTCETYFPWGIPSFDQLTFAQLQSAEALHAQLVAQAYVDPGTTPSEVIASITPVVDDPEGCPQCE